MAHACGVEEPEGPVQPPPQSVQRAEPAQAENVPASHGAHVEGAVAPGLAENAPGGQEEQEPPEVAPAAPL
jgi:hypothetical protein